MIMLITCLIHIFETHRILDTFSVNKVCRFWFHLQSKNPSQLFLTPARPLCPHQQNQTEEISISSKVTVINWQNVSPKKNYLQFKKKIETGNWKYGIFVSIFPSHKTRHGITLLKRKSTISHREPWIPKKEFKFWNKAYQYSSIKMEQHKETAWTRISSKYNSKVRYLTGSLQKTTAKTGVAVFCTRLKSCL